MKSLKVLSTLLLSAILVSIAMPSWAIFLGQRGSGGRSTAPTACGTLSYLAGYNNYRYILSNTSQQIHLTGGQCSVITVKLRMYYDTFSGDAHLEIWDGPNTGSDNQIGNDSNTQTVSLETPGAEIVFTFSGTYPSGDYYLHIIEESGDLYVMTHSDETTYEDTNYDFIRNLVDLDEDLAFIINE